MWTNNLCKLQGLFSFDHVVYSHETRSGADPEKKLTVDNLKF